MCFLGVPTSWLIHRDSLERERNIPTSFFTSEALKGIINSLNTRKRGDRAIPDQTTGCAQKSWTLRITFFYRVQCLYRLMGSKLGHVRFFVLSGRLWLRKKGSLIKSGSLLFLFGMNDWIALCSWNFFSWCTSSETRKRAHENFTEKLIKIILEKEPSP